jgi:hypothetical protein
LKEHTGCGYLHGNEQRKKFVMQPPIWVFKRIEYRWEKVKLIDEIFGGEM